MDNGSDDSEILSASPERLLQQDLDALRTYTECAQLLGQVDLEFEYDTLDDVPVEAAREAERHTRYMQRIASYYLGDSPEEAISSMSFVGLLRLGRRMGKDVDWHTCAGEMIEFKKTIWKFYDEARKKTVERLDRKVISVMDQSEDVAASESLAGDMPEFEQDPRALQLAIERFNRATKQTLPGVGDFSKLRELISSSGAVALSLSAPFMERFQRMTLARRIFENMHDPENIRQIYGEKEWGFYLQFRHAPQTFTDQVKLHKEAFEEMDRAEVAVEGIPARARVVLELLESVTSSALRRNIMSALENISKIASDNGDTDSKMIQNAAKKLKTSLDYVDDEDFKTEVGEKVDLLLAA